MPHLSNYDFLFASIILISAALATIRGGVSELLSISTWFIALFVTRNYAEFIERYIPEIISNELFRSLITYIISFIGVAIIITLLKMTFNKAISKTGLSGLNYLLGALFGIVRGIIICSLLVILMEMFSIDKDKGWNNSWFSPILKPAVNMIISATPKDMENLNNEIGKHATTIIEHEANKLQESGK